MKYLIPQMSPLMWFSLFILFSMTLLLFNQMNFFSFKMNPTKMNKKSEMKISKINWKW
uniref:ATP synthase complex subunit 8 n=1 Tax=Lentula callani TaxID=1260738 RepID=M4JCA3_9ORTH|nr:ATP synthase F0 subunit 8 [Lentula callani]AGC22312.1 ATP synthase F0 subunit 8 [Lentula callani]